MKMNLSVGKLISSVLKEDHTAKDVTTRFLVHPQQKVTAYVIAKERKGGILCGIEIAKEIFRKTDSRCKIKLLSEDGRKFLFGQKLMTIHGNASKLFSAERAALNFLQHLSGVATITRKFVDEVEGTGVKIYDTRKTIPGLRELQKYAVRCGRGHNHRMNLNEMALVKDNHLKAVADNPSRLENLKSKLPKNTLLEIEAENLKEVRWALRSNADIILLDNMNLQTLKKSIEMIRSGSVTHPHKPLIEVSGGITLENVRAIARLGVDRIAVGAITHSVSAQDISMEVVISSKKLVTY